MESDIRSLMSAGFAAANLIVHRRSSWEPRFAISQTSKNRGLRQAAFQGSGRAVFAAAFRTA